MLISGHINLKMSLANRSFLTKNGIISSIYIGDQTAASISQVGLEIRRLIKRINQKGKNALILSDVSGMGKVNLGARKAGVQLFRELNYERLAIIGVTFLTQSLVSAVVNASGRGYKIRIFDKEAEAKQWLLNQAA
jgi:hypothetical protein